MTMRLALPCIVLIQLLTACSQGAMEVQSVDVVFELPPGSMANVDPAVAQKQSLDISYASAAMLGNKQRVP